MTEVTPMARVGHPLPQPAEFTHSTPDTFLRDLEALVSSLEDSFANSESTLEGKSSPRASAKLQVEKKRRQKLLQKISSVLHSSPGSAPHGGETSLASEEDSMSFNAAGGDDTGASEWKKTTLLRLRKFLKKKYRQKKSKLIDSASKPGVTSEWMSSEKSQIMQIAADIRSLEFEIRLLSGAKTVQQVTRQGSSALLDSSSAGKLGHTSGSKGGAGQHLSGMENTSSASGGGASAGAGAGGGLSGIKKQLLNFFTHEDPLEQDRTSLSEAILEDEDPRAAGAPQPSRVALALDGSSAILDDSDADKSSEEILSAGPKGLRAKVDRPNLNAVKRNLVSCFEDRDVANISTSSAKHQASALKSRRDAEQSKGGAARDVNESSSLGDIAFEQTESSGSSAVGEWTDVDLGRWATVSKKAAVSPVAARVTAASPMPVVLQHRVLERHAVACEAGVIETLDTSADSLSLDEAMMNTSVISSIHCEDDDGPSLFQSLPLRRRSTGVDDALSVGVLPPMPEEADQAAMFDSTMEVEAAEGDEALGKLMTRILSGPRPATPLTSRYRGNDPSLVGKAKHFGDESGAEEGGNSGDTGESVQELAKLCVKELKMGYGGAFEGRNLWAEFESLPLHETVVRTSAALLASTRPASPPLAEQSCDAGDYAYVGDATPSGEAPDECNRVLSFGDAATEQEGDELRVSEEGWEERGASRVNGSLLQGEEQEEEVGEVVSDDSLIDAPISSSPEEDVARVLVFAPNKAAAPGGELRASQEVAKRLDFGGFGGEAVLPRLPCDSPQRKDSKAANESQDESFEASAAEGGQVAAAIENIGVRVDMAARSPKLSVTGDESASILEGDADSSLASSRGDAASPDSSIFALTATKESPIAAKVSPIARRRDHKKHSEAPAVASAGGARAASRGGPSPSKTQAARCASTRGMPSPGKRDSPSRAVSSAAKRTPSPKGGPDSSSRPVNRPTTPTPHRRVPYKAPTTSSPTSSSPGDDEPALPQQQRAQSSIEAKQVRPVGAAGRPTTASPSDGSRAATRPRAALTPLGTSTQQQQQQQQGTGGGLLGNKTDLLSSLRNARKGGTGEGPLSSSARKAEAGSTLSPPMPQPLAANAPDAAAPAVGRRVVVQDRLRALRPLPPPTSSSAPIAGAPVGGKRVSAPAVHGSGVASLNPLAGPEGIVADQGVLDQLRSAAAEKLALYRSKIAEGSSSAGPGGHRDV